MFVLVLICVACGLYSWWNYTSRNSRCIRPPSSDGWLPIIGHLHKIFGNSEHLYTTVMTLAEETNIKGGVISYYVGPRTYFIITDPEDALTAANACLNKHFVYRFTKDWLGDGLITSSELVWKRHRKLLNPAFHIHVLHSFFGVFNSQARQLVDGLASEVGRGSIDVTTHMNDYALKTICMTAFGIIVDEDGTFHKSYMHAVYQMLDIIIHRFQHVWLQSARIFKLTGYKKKQDEVIKILSNMSHMMIQRKKAERNISSTDPELHSESPNGLKYNAFMDLLLNLSDDNALTDKEIREELDTLIVAGFDTSSTLLTYIFVLLGSYPEVQDRVYNELQEVINDNDRDIEKEDLIKLVYTDAVIKETLRLYYIVPATLRSVRKDVNLKNYTMKAGDQCVILFCGMNRHPVWGADRHEFKPERWLDPATLPDNPAAFAGFGNGKRTCIGKTFAMMSLRVAVAHTLRRYRVTADISKLKFKLDFVTKPVSGHYVSLERRV